MTFQGFDRKAVELLRTLPGLDAESYAAHRELLGEDLIKPGGELVGELAPRFEGGLAMSARTSVSPLHTDLRFAPAGSPRYKDHLLLTAWHGPDKRTGVTLWIRLDADTVGFACGVGFTPQVRDRWRQAVASENGEGLARTLAALQAAHREHDFEIIGELLKRPPSPWDEQHPRAELLRRTGFQLRFTEPLPTELVGQPALMPWCKQRVEQLEPVLRWLVAVLASGRRATATAS